MLPYTPKTPADHLIHHSVAASAYTTYWLVHPNSKSGALDRWPLEVESPEDCVVCGKEEKGNNPLECEKVSVADNSTFSRF
jgi:hypothetical protein